MDRGASLEDSLVEYSTRGAAYREFIESCRIRESATYDLRLIGVIWSSE